jgi:hypothetical protein
MKGYKEKGQRSQRENCRKWWESKEVGRRERKQAENKNKKGKLEV